MKINELVSMRKESIISRSKTVYSTKKENRLRKGFERIIFSFPIWNSIFSKYTNNLVLNEKELMFSNLPSEFKNFKILFISDLHFDIEPNPLERLIGLDLPKYDIVILGGDYFDNHENYNYSKISKLILKLNKPVYAIMGNHDSLDTLKQMEAIGVKFLLNQTIQIEKNNQSIIFTGIDETVNNENGTQIKHMDEIKYNYDGFKILLSHSPDMLMDAYNAGYSLQLSGHTHGGQCLIFNKAIYKNTKYDFAMSGIWKYKNLKGYTSSGFGSSGFPIRNIVPEVVLITLNNFE
jgi:predicted MPP superfamily phosphohydrolase